MCAPLKFATRVLAARLALVILAAGNAPGVLAQEIRIGNIADQSGIEADVGRDYLAGARTYFDYINASGGINGRKIAVIEKDDGGQPANTVRLTRELIEKDRVDVLFGYVGDDGLRAVAGDAYFKSSGMTLYAPLSGAEIGSAADHIYFVRPTYREEARHIVQHFTLLGNKNFAVLATANRLGETLAGQLGEELKARGLGAAARFTLSTDLRNIDATVRELAQLKPQVVVVAADTIAMAEFLKRFRMLDKGTNVVGFSTVNHRTLLEIARPDFAVSTLITQVVPHPAASNTRLQVEHRALMAKFRDEPPSHLTLEGFLAAKGLVRALERAGKDLSRGSIAAALSGDKRFDLDGMTLVFTRGNDRGSHFVDLAYLRRDGKLVQ
ncbi:MAG TPA: ABC transporter substrate-binding protein [Usitatibacteraceae bacterium]